MGGVEVPQAPRVGHWGGEGSWPSRDSPLHGKFFVFFLKIP